MEKFVTGILVALFLVMIVATIMIIVFGDRKSHVTINVPDNVDVVIVDRGRGRTRDQIRSVDQHMPWVKKIIVARVPNEGMMPVKALRFSERFLDASEPAKTQSRKATIVYAEAKHRDLRQIFEDVKNLDVDVSDHFIFLGDTTMPVRDVDPEDFWSRTKKLRIFNYLNVDARVAGFQDFYETTMPCMIVESKDLEEAGSLKNYLLALALTDSIVHCPSINKVIVLTQNSFADEEQANKKLTKAQKFMTVLISPPLDRASTEKMNDRMRDITARYEQIVK